MHDTTAQPEPQAQTVHTDRGSWRRKLPLRTSVRALMVFVLILGGALGWVVHLAHVQRDAVMAIRSGGGQVMYDWQYTRLPNGKTQLDPKGRPTAPKWLIDYLGPDYFGHVEFVTLGPKETNAAMKQVAGLEQLRWIQFRRSGIDLTPVARAGLESLPIVGVSRFRGLWGLMRADLSPPPFDGANFKYLKNMTRLEHLGLPAECSITDADLAHLSRLTALTQLQLHDPRISDAGLASLKNMTQLKFLRLSGTQVTGAGLKSLRGMRAIKTLDLEGTRVDDLSSIVHLTLLSNLQLSKTPIGDKGLAPVAGLIGLDQLTLNQTNVTSASYPYLKLLSKLTGLSLRKTRVGDEGSVALAELTALLRLDLDDTLITDATVSHLARMPKLNTLTLTKTQITDSGLATLTACKALRRLNVRSTKISQDGVRAFRKARPDVVVVQ